MDIEDFVNAIMKLDEAERIKFINTMKEVIYRWKGRHKSELRWMEELEKMELKEEEEDFSRKNSK